MPKPKGSDGPQFITTYGPGAIVAVHDESFMVAGIDRWPVDQPDLLEPRLQRSSPRRWFVRPPVGGSGETSRWCVSHAATSPQSAGRLAPRVSLQLQEPLFGCDSPLVPARS